MVVSGRLGMGIGMGIGEPGRREGARGMESSRCRLERGGVGWK